MFICLDNSNCTLPPDIGFIDLNKSQIRIITMRYFYNATGGVCSTFYYIGEGGNANNFETEDQCNRVCCKF